MTCGSKTNTLETPHLTHRTGQTLPVAKHICTPLSADLWDNLSPQASSQRTRLGAAQVTSSTSAKHPAFPSGFNKTKGLHVIRSSLKPFDKVIRGGSTKHRGQEATKGKRKELQISNSTGNYLQEHVADQVGVPERGS